MDIYNYNKQLSIFSDFNEDKGFVLLPQVKFHFFTSHVPCGDASIIPKLTDCSASTSGNKRKSADSDSDIQTESKRLKNNEPAANTSNEDSKLESRLSVSDENNVENETAEDNNKKNFENLMNSDDCVLNDCVGELILDVHRTGAKCVPSGEQDRKLPGVKYHILGAVRTKPGRGNPTLSVSCSDKMARWIATGIQVNNTCQ